MDAELQTYPDFEIVPEDWKRTPPSVQQMILRLMQRLASLEQEVSTLRAEDERLRVHRPGSDESRGASRAVLSPATRGISGSSIRSSSVVMSPTTVPVSAALAGWSCPVTTPTLIG